MRFSLCLVLAIAACSVDEVHPFGGDATGGAGTGGASTGGAATGGGTGGAGTGGAGTGGVGTGGVGTTGGAGTGGANTGGAGTGGAGTGGTGGAPGCVLPDLATTPCAADLASIGAMCRDYVGADGAPVASDCRAPDRAALGSCAGSYMGHPWHCVAACPWNLCQ